MKKTILFFVKTAISGILALIVLSVLCIFYYDPPISIAQPDKFTNNKFKANDSWSVMVEGVGYGKTNSSGYITDEEYSYSDNIIAVMGSSHTEARQVPQSENYVSLLGDKFSEKTKCVNFGVAGHSFDICVSNYRYLTEAFENLEHVVIETSSLTFSPEKLEKMLNEEYHKDLRSRGSLYNLIQKIPYFRLLSKQYQDLQSKNDGDSSNQTAIDYVAYEEALLKVMEKLSYITEENDTALTIMYHRWIKANADTASRKDDMKVVEIFKKCCKRYGIGFVDVTDSFISHYNDTYELPYGFLNTTMGSGHLNKTGHRIIADELYKHITKNKEEK